MSLLSPSPRLRARLVLLAAAAVVLLLGVQTVLALRAQQNMARRVLHDHAATALWYFEQNLEAELNSAIECVFHDALHTVLVDGEARTLRAADPHPVLPPVHPILADWYTDAQCAAAFLPPPLAVYRFGPGAQSDIAGAAPGQAQVAEVRALVEAAARLGVPVRRSDGIVAGSVGGTPRAYLYSRQQGPAGAAVYAAPLEGDAMTRLAARALRDFRLLPPPVLPDSLRAGVMRVGLGVRHEPLHALGPDGPAVATAVRELAPHFGGLTARAEITAAGAALLAQTPPQAARLSGLLALLALSLLLVGLAYRQLRREQELAALRGDFVASVSHELRTPLALQRIFLDTIRLGRAQSPERMEWALDNVDREAHRLEHLVGNVLHFARGERGQLSVDPQRTVLLDAVRRTAAAFAPLAEQRDATIHVSGDGSVEAPIDEHAFHQALGNVLENAIKYGPTWQRVEITVRAEAGAAVVEIDDEGSGLPAEERVAVLEPYRRGRSARGGPIAGSGIGLAVVRDVMRLHGGDVALDASPAGGLRVRLTLPQAGIAAAQADADAQPAAPQPVR